MANRDEPTTYAWADRAHRSNDALIGAVIDNRYRIESKIGQGGMGSVYLGTRLLIGDKVAIKILDAEPGADEQAVERFRREAQAAARLKHPNVVTIHDFGVSSAGLAYLVMEMVEGISLRQLIRNRGALAPALAAEILRQVCAALDEAHRNHIVHRDLKPDNILINEGPNGLSVKVLDFGIAKMRDLSTTGNLTQTGTLMGTPYYMSPEQCRAEELDARSDIYSLGIVLYEMLTGSVPFEAAVTTAVILQHVSAQPPSMRERNSNITPAIEGVVMDALEKEKAMRPQTAGELAREMTAALSGSPIYPNAANYSNSPNRAPQELAPTIQMQPSGFMSGQTTPAGLSSTAGSQAAKGSRSKIPLIIIVAVLLIAIAAGAAFRLTRAGNKGKEGGDDKAATPGADAQNRAGDSRQSGQQPQVSEDRIIESERSLQRGQAYATQGKFSLAAEEFNRSAELNPNNALAWANLASAHIILKQHDQAQSACDKAIAADSSNWLARYNLGSLHAMRGSNAEAIAELSEALRLVAQNKSQKMNESDLKKNMRNDESLKPLRGDPRFKQLVTE